MGRLAWVRCRYTVLCRGCPPAQFVCDDPIKDAKASALQFVSPSIWGARKDGPSLALIALFFCTCLEWAVSPALLLSSLQGTPKAALTHCTRIQHFPQSRCSLLLVSAGIIALYCMVLLLCTGKRSTVLWIILKHCEAEALPLGGRKGTKARVKQSYTDTVLYCIFRRVKRIVVRRIAVKYRIHNGQYLTLSSFRGPR